MRLHSDRDRALEFQQKCSAIKLSGRTSGVAPRKGAFLAREARRHKGDDANLWQKLIRKNVNSVILYLLGIIVNAVDIALLEHQKECEI
jgi:hypothetical protein